MMNSKRTVRICKKAIAIAATAACLVTAGTLPVFAHGGKTHAENAFTALQAVRKATQLYDRLIVSGKLPGEWETGLKTIHVELRETKDKQEYVIRFQRTQGDPGSVYFYFNRAGEYTGSNFHGN